MIPSGVLFGYAISAGLAERSLSARQPLRTPEKHTLQSFLEKHGSHKKTFKEA